MFSVSQLITLFQGPGAMPTEACSCAVEFGGPGGDPFSMFSSFEASENWISNITVFFHSGEGLKG